MFQLQINILIDTKAIFTAVDMRRLKYGFRTPLMEIPLNAVKFC